MASVTSKCRLICHGFVTTLFSLLLPGMGRETSLQVVCPGAGPGAYSTITAALSALDPPEPNTITVSGNCNRAEPGQRFRRSYQPATDASPPSRPALEASNK